MSVAAPDPRRKNRRATATDRQRRAAAELDRRLDHALGETFPASDPISLILPQPKATTQLQHDDAVAANRALADE